MFLKAALKFIFTLGLSGDCHFSTPILLAGKGLTLIDRVMLEKPSNPFHIFEI
ncbi:Uncharacterized protein F383_30126 [Gossypium arboreum]|uniref:Uncharacterized protein n=4 Tax=Gossypium TaxID=3633 RepID=A0A0B0MRX0_GOSAR|nr:Uncharacterized protein F383_30126 [Gossypium arboreum]TYG97946.1 hypothetical protein ES288_A10G078600v1 [Gossypium darwinii]TYI05282.1 hypothetical protein ES332_A10G078100v1 [Gossypium tomentosum]TYJ13795.1 hypothetical protein E1A91_A10G074600v1 [Gossypium mustelinum]